MSYRLVADTSFLFKLAFANPQAEAAERICERYVLIAPAFIQVELANALWKAVRFGGLKDAQALSAFNQLTALYSPVPDEEIVEKAIALALRIGHSVYDCMFAALAAEAAIPLITADRKLISVLSAAAPDIQCLDITSLPAGVIA